jgi:hypothetical protein
VPARSLGLAALLLTIVAAVGVWWAYGSLIHYERRAALHLPRDADFVARLDLEQVVMFEPVRKYLLPLVDDVPLRRPGATDATRPETSRLERLRTLSGINLAADLREVAVSWTRSSREWVAVLGGLFPKTGVIAAIDASLRAEGVRGVVREGEDLLAFGGSAAVLGQADDGVLILASSRSRLERARLAAEAPDGLGVGRATVFELAASGGFLDELFTSLVAPDAPWVGSVLRVRLRGQLGDELQLDGSIDATDATALSAMTRAFARRDPGPHEPEPFAPQADWAGERAIAARARVLSTSENTIMFSSSCRHTEFEHGLRNLANWVQRLLQARKLAAP